MTRALIPAPTPTPLCTIVPPYLLEAIAANLPGFLQSSAAGTLLFDEQLRARRQAAAATVPAPSPATPTAGPSTAVEVRPRRSIFDASEGSPGRLARSEGDPASGDLSVDRAYDGLGETFAYFRDVHERDSLDGRGLPLRAQVHVGQQWENAAWDGEQMLFGDGDGEIFGDFTASLDVIAHELTHGVTQYERQLVYQGQSGALNESMSDVFGILVKQWAAGQTAEESDWLIGEDLLLPGVAGAALRSMAAPGTAYDDPRLGGRDPQPAHMRDFIVTEADAGGVHLNSGIPNRAFHLAATALGGRAWEGAGPVWYSAMRDPDLSATASFADFAAVTVLVASGMGEQVAAAVRSAWAQVGVLLVEGTSIDLRAQSVSLAAARAERPDVREGESR